MRAEADKQLKETAEPAAARWWTTRCSSTTGARSTASKFPHKMRRAMGGATTEEWTVNKVKVNPKIDPKKFEG